MNFRTKSTVCVAAMAIAAGCGDVPESDSDPGTEVRASALGQSCGDLVEGKDVCDMTAMQEYAQCICANINSADHFNECVMGFVGAFARQCEDLKEFREQEKGLCEKGWTNPEFCEGMGWNQPGGGGVVDGSEDEDGGKKQIRCPNCEISK